MWTCVYSFYTRADQGEKSFAVSMFVHIYIYIYIYILIQKLNLKALLLNF